MVAARVAIARAASRPAIIFVTNPPATSTPVIPARGASPSPHGRLGVRPDHRDGQPRDPVAASYLIVLIIADGRVVGDPAG